ncbi:acyl transferase [Dyadobacter tibetensis]|uniref:acyl transferase n=1 Tax=Dyadobacter tibetensis TaxID=1211851 RepID=UPI0004B6AA12|nr:acyl transferase [Dyadobacter tibetensis]
MRKELRQRILDLRDSDFETLAMDIFHYQSEYNPIYAQFIKNIGKNPKDVTKLKDIPFLPIQFFKSQQIITATPPPLAKTFESSGTTGMNTSRHQLHDPELYQKVARKIFELHYGPLSEFHILALLPSYLERNNSSLVYMIEDFIAQTDSPYSGFFLHNTEVLLEQLERLIIDPLNKKILLMGVTFALLDMAEQNDLSLLKMLPRLIVMDTGGMKGRRKEWIREEIHEFLSHSMYQKSIHSEYGMTELISQAYAQEDGLFCSRYTFRALLRDIHDPFAVYEAPHPDIRTGGINVIDLANLDSCSFIETQDLGQFGKDYNHFRVLGRFDNSDIRGCNLLLLG